MTYAPIIVFWALLVWGMVSPRPVLIYLFFGAAAFGSLAIVPPELTGGVTLTPQPMCAAALVGRILLDREGLGRAYAALRDRRRLGLLAAFLIWALATAVFNPRYFAGHTYVVAMRSATDLPEPLQPTAANITQSVYVTLSCAAAAAFAVLLSSSAMRRHAMYALLVGGGVLIVSGVLDMVAPDALLAPFRTATYALLTEATVGSTRRVIGLMTEASSFGATCVIYGAILYFLRPLMPEGAARRFVLPAVLAGLVGMAAVSTSSTAYVGLGLVVLVAGVNWMRRFMFYDPRDRTVSLDALVVIVGGIGLGLTFLFDPAVMQPILVMVDTMVFKKTQSASYEDRMMWSTTALKGLEDTHGLGVGLGGARTSNWAVATLSNTGVIGGVLMAGFLLTVFLRRASVRSFDIREAVIGAKLVIAIELAMAMLSATTVDFGVEVGFLLGLVIALSDLKAAEPALSRRRVRRAPRTEPQTRATAASTRG